MQTYRGPTRLVAEGKTKKILRYVKDPGICRIVSKNDTTAGDGAKREVIPGKARLVNEIACSVFELLERKGVPTAYKGKHDPLSLDALFCGMIPLEIVVRFAVDGEGSYVKRSVRAKAGDRFREPVVELFLKTTGRRWNHQTLPCDDPLLVQEGDLYAAYLPNAPLIEQSPLLRLSEADIGLSPGDMPTILGIAPRVGAVLQEAWASVRAELIDFKMEAGYAPDGSIVPADLIGPDEWRLRADISKQGFRKGEKGSVVRKKYDLTADLAKSFAA